MTTFNTTRLEEKVGANSISLETGYLAKQADGSVIVRMGDTAILATAVCTKEQKPGVADFVPITVNYKERTYAAGKIPGGFFKREGRPSMKEVLSSRLSDRAVRPLFPEGFNCETNVTSLVVSHDGVNDPDILGITASSAALTISSIPFDGPVAGVRVGMENGKLILNPTLAQRENASVDLVIAGTLKGILMVEGGCKEMPDSTVIEAMELAKPEIDKLCNMQIALREKAGKEKFSFKPTLVPEDVKKAAEETARPEIVKILKGFLEKKAREQAVSEVKKALIAKFEAQYPADAKSFVGFAVEGILYEESRRLVLNDRVRVDGRKTDQIRPLHSQVGYFPRTHGSAVFTRGQTQALVACTLGTPEDMQLVEGLDRTYKERFLLHYNFPGFATGEVKRDMSPGRREIGHGELARRALLPLVPAEEDFAYTIRLVSDILESNGSSSMASVCGGSLSMFDAGVPMKSAVAGIAMGLITDGDKYAVLSDIMGMEDHLGDMDFKVAGTRNGVTAFQMDVKLPTGIPIAILKEAVAQAHNGRLHILEHMDSVISAPRGTMSQFAPRLFRVTIPRDKIGALIGPSGKNIRRIIEETDSKIEVNDDGVVFISGLDATKVEAARKYVEYYTAEVEVGQVYKGKVVSIQNFGAFVEVLPGKEGLLHISEIAPHRINRVEDVLQMGDEVDVKVVEMDNIGKFRLSRKVLLPPQEKKGGQGRP